MDINALQDRITQLEARVAELERRLDAKQTGESRANPATAPRPAPVSGSPPKTPFTLTPEMRSYEYWLNKIGIGLVLFGLAFLFKYSIDQGWLTPTVRIVFGFILGVVLINAGDRIARNRRNFGQVLLGGGIATFYINIFAAFQLFALIPHLPAFALMIGVTVLAFFLAVRQNNAVLAILGVLGGLGTPFLLYTEEGSVPGLVVYTSLMLAGSMAVFYRRGWRSLPVVTVIGGWLIYIVINETSLAPTAPEAATPEHWSVQAGLVFAWLIFWLVPLLRSVVAVSGPGRRGWPAIADARPQKSPATDPVHGLTVSSPLIMLWLMQGVWRLSDTSWGLLYLLAALIVALVTQRLFARGDALRDLGFTHALAAIMLLSIAFYHLLSGDSLLFTLATEAAVLHLIARRQGNRLLSGAAHVLATIAGLWLLQRVLDESAAGTALVNLPALTDLWVIAALGVAARRLPDALPRRFYFGAVHVAVLAWFSRELAPLSQGQAYVTIAWAVYAIALLIAGLRLNKTRLQQVAMLTVLLVIGKLFLVDLQALETIWRVLLFLSFGAFLLLLSYFYQKLWKKDDDQA